MLKRILLIFLIPILLACESESDKRQPITPLISQKPDFSSVLNILNEAVDNNPTAQNYFLRSRLYFKENKLLESLDDINASIKIDNTEPKYFLLRAKIYYGLKKINAALRDAENAESQQLKTPELYIFLTELYVLKKLYKKALLEINKSIDIAPYQSSAWLWKGVATLKTGDTTNGINHLKTSLLYSPGTISFYQLGRVYNSLKDYKSAKYYIMDGLKFDSLEANLIYEMAENYRFTGGTDTAKYLYLKSVKKNPEIYKAYYETGKLFFNEHDYDNALNYFEKIKNKKTEFPQLEMLLAMTYDFTGKYEDAYDEYTQVINNDLINNGDTTNYKAIERHWQLKKLIDGLHYQYKMDSIRNAVQNPFLQQN